MEEEQQSGEAPCFLNELDEEDSVLDPRGLIRLQFASASSGTFPSAALTVEQRCEDAVTARHVSELGPRSGETLEAYRERLQGPICRTLAWQVALMTSDGPISIVLPDGCRDDPRTQLLLDYLRELISS